MLYPLLTLKNPLFGVSFAGLSILYRLNFGKTHTVEYKIKPPTLRVGGLILYCGSVRITLRLHPRGAVGGGVI